VTTYVVKGARLGRRDRAWSLYAYLTVMLALILAGVGMFKIFGHEGAVRAGQQQLEQTWSSSLGEQVGTASAGALVSPPKPLPGNALARMTVPSLNQSWIVVEGTSLADIATAPGHYSFSAMPGKVGNFSVAGHREIGIFWDLDEIKPGNKIVVETRSGTFTYVVTRNFITAPDSWAEVSPTPPGFRPGSKVLTLTTCNPKWDNYERLVIHAVLT
jgi:sortase A